METAYFRPAAALGWLTVFLWVTAVPASAQVVVEPTIFKEVLFSERQVNSEHLVVGVVARERRRSVRKRSKSVLLRMFDEHRTDEFCGEVRSLDGLYFGEMRYPALDDRSRGSFVRLAYPSQKLDVFAYDSGEIAVRLQGCTRSDEPPIFYVASWLGHEGDTFMGADILLNTQSGTGVYAYIGTTSLTCKPEPDDTQRDEIDYRCFIADDQFDPASVVSLIVDRNGSRDPVVQLRLVR